MYWFYEFLSVVGLYAHKPIENVSESMRFNMNEKLYLDLEILSSWVSICFSQLD